MYPLRKAHTQIKKDRIKHGTYESVVEKVSDAPGYVPGNAAQITYKLTRDEKSWNFREVFVFDPNDPRYAEFSAYLEDHGIDDISDFVGCREEVQLLRQVKDDRGTFLNIVDRKMLDR